MNHRLLTALLTLSAVTSSFSAQAATEEAYCREYQRNVTIAGEEEHAYGTACLQPDGAWKIVSEQEGGTPADAPETEQVVIVQEKIIIKDAPVQPHYRHGLGRAIVFSSPYYRGRHRW